MNRLVWRWVSAGTAAYGAGFLGWWFARPHEKANDDEIAADVLGFLALALGLLCVGTYFAGRP